MLAVQCVVIRFRPILHGNISYFRLPSLPESSVGWILEAPLPVGFCAFDALPGLPHIGDLYVFVLASERRNGYGTDLLEKVSNAAQKAGIRQLSTLVENPQSGTAQFLLKHGFYEEHLEIELMLELTTPVRPTLEQLVTYPPEKTTHLMQQLYDSSFSQTAWYQPYTDVAEIEESLLWGSQVYFLLQHGEPIGFASVKIEGEVAEIEPLGIVKQKQGQGFGRILLQALLHNFSLEPIKRVRLAVWQKNIAALALYESFGFCGVSTRTFFAKDLD